MNDIPDLEDVCEKRIIIPKLNDIPEIDKMDFVVIKEKSSCFQRIFFTPRILFYSSMLLLIPALYALYYYRIFFAVIYGGLWLTSILNWNNPVEHSNINMIDRIMCQIVMCCTLASIYFYHFDYVGYLFSVLIILCYFLSYLVNYYNNTFWIPPHFIMHLLVIITAFMMIDSCYEIDCSPFTDFYQHATQ